MRARPERLAMLLAGLYAPLALAAEPAPIVTERPSFSASTSTVPLGTVQIEAGYQFTDQGNNVEDHTAPFGLVRVPLREDRELQLGWGGVSHERGTGRTRFGALDPTVGLKQALPGVLPNVDVALIGAVSLPVGADRLSTGQAEVNASAWWSLQEGLPLFGGFVLASEDGELRSSTSLGVSIPVRENVGAFVEWFGSRVDGTSEHSVDAGVSFVTANDLQLDVYVGAGLDDQASDFFLGFGVGHRF